MLCVKQSLDWQFLKTDGNRPDERDVSIKSVSWGENGSNHQASVIAGIGSSAHECGAMFN